MNEEGDGGGAGYKGEASPFQRPARRPLLHRLVPVTEQVPGYRGGTLRQDLLAGVTVAALALPSSLAYAEIAGLSPVIGLYALLLPALAYALLGSSRQVIVGPDGSIAALVGTAVIPLTADPDQRAGLAALLCTLALGYLLPVGLLSVVLRIVVLFAVYAAAILLLFGVQIDVGDYWMGKTGKPTRQAYDLKYWTLERLTMEFAWLDEEVNAGNFPALPEEDKCRRCSVRDSCSFKL